MILDIEDDPYVEDEVSEARGFLDVVRGIKRHSTNLGSGGGLRSAISKAKKAIKNAGSGVYAGLSKLRTGISKSSSLNTGGGGGGRRPSVFSRLRKGLKAGLSKAGKVKLKTPNIRGEISKVSSGVLSSLRTRLSKAGQGSSLTLTAYLSKIRKGLKKVTWSKVKNAIKEVRKEIQDNRPDDLKGYLKTEYGEVIDNSLSGTNPFAAVTANNINRQGPGGISNVSYWWSLCLNSFIKDNIFRLE